MSELTPEVVTRLAKLIQRLASEHAGEVAATVAAIARTLQAGGCDLHDLPAHVAIHRRIGDACRVAGTQPIGATTMKRRQKRRSWGLDLRAAHTAKKADP